MKKIMTYEAFEEEYMDAVRRGTEMLCVWDDDEDYHCFWYPHTKDMYDKLAYETDMLMHDEAVEAVADWDMVFDGVLAEYYDTLREAAKEAYNKYREEVGEDDEF